MAHESRIKCYVDSCEYWGHGNKCMADEIEVDNMHRTRPGKGDMELGQLGAGHGEARKSEETCCETFRPRRRG